MNKQGLEPGEREEARGEWLCAGWLCAELAANEGFSLFNFEINGCIDLQLSQLMEQHQKGYLNLTAIVWHSESQKKSVHK